jgi:pimeloyl-ACP methyl ester carboxylesterase
MACWPPVSRGGALSASGALGALTLLLGALALLGYALAFHALLAAASGASLLSAASGWRRGATAVVLGAGLVGLVAWFQCAATIPGWAGYGGARVVMWTLVATAAGASLGGYHTALFPRAAVAPGAALPPGAAQRKSEVANAAMRRPADSRCGRRCSVVTAAACVAFTLLASYDAVARAADAHLFGADVGERVTLRDGRVVVARCQGTGDLAVFMEHGLGGNALDFAWLQADLARDFRACSIDRAGYGLSLEVPPRSANRSSAVLADETAQVLAGLGISQAVFVGHSFAGFNLRMLYRQVPEAFLGLVLVDAVNPNATWWPCGDELAEDWSMRICTSLTESGIFRLLYDGIMTSIDAHMPDMPPDVQRAYKAGMIKSTWCISRRQEWVWWPVSCAALRALSPEQRRIDVPLTSIASTVGIHQGHMELSRELADLSPRGKYIELNDSAATHVGLLHQRNFSAIVADAVRDIIRAL